MMKTSATPTVQAFFDAQTWTYTYVVFESIGSACVIIDSVLNYDAHSGRTNTHGADEVIAFVQEQRLQLQWILETHAHADHLTAAPYIQKKLGGKIAIGNHITELQKVFKGIFNMADLAVDGSQFDTLIKEGERLVFGNLSLQALFVPGHTPACMAYAIGDSIFVGDTLFMPDVGTARCDFPGGSARHLYRSIQLLLTYPPNTKLYLCHDYPPNGRALEYQSTVADQKAANIHVHDGITEDQYVAMRTQRDAGLGIPVLLLPSIQVNIRAGHMPKAEGNGTAYLKIPLNIL